LGFGVWGFGVWGLGAHPELEVCPARIAIARILVQGLGFGVKCLVLSVKCPVLRVWRVGSREEGSHE